MAPSTPSGYDITPTNIFTGVISTASGLVYHNFEHYQENRYEKKETKQEKLDRISLEKKMASQKVYNDRTPNIKFIKQTCKPQHRLPAGVFRGMR